MARNGAARHNVRMPAPLRLLLVDDNRDFLQSLALFLSRFDHLKVVSLTDSGPAGVEHAMELAPDLVLMDLAMPGCNGLEATRRLRGSGCDARVIILTLVNGAQYRESAQRAGADGFVSKGDITTALLPTIAALFSPGGELVEAP
jgi:DNA-binding NarL/FixJ family response regulator